MRDLLFRSGLVLLLAGILIFVVSIGLSPDPVIQLGQPVILICVLAWAIGVVLISLGGESDTFSGRLIRTTALSGLIAVLTSGAVWLLFHLYLLLNPR